MFETAKPTSTRSLIFNMLEVTFHASVRKVRQKHGNALMAIATSLMQSIIFVLAFYFMFTVLGTRAVAIRGDFMLYLLTGIFLYLVHVQTVGAVAGAENSTSPMMQHAPMNTLVSILAAAFSTLYIKSVSLIVILLIMHTLLQPVEIHQWGGAFLLFLLAWGCGVAVGMIFLALKPWMPDAVAVLRMVYIRVNMIASGKMFVANMMPGFMIDMFDWNPLFHIIDQIRGYTFVNYFPHNSNWQYPLYFTLVLILLGLMAEFYTRKHASSSWEARR